MSTCEKCWVDAGLKAHGISLCQVEVYRDLVRSRECTPEEQAGPYADVCGKCNRKVLHQLTGEHMGGV